MAKMRVCDLCGDKVDDGWFALKPTILYKYKLWGYEKQKVDVCDGCMRKIRIAIQKQLSEVKE